MGHVVTAFSGGACGCLTEIARPARSSKVGRSPFAARADAVVVEQSVVAGAEQDEVLEFGHATALDPGEVVRFELAQGAEAEVPAVP